MSDEHVLDPEKERVAAFVTRILDDLKPDVKGKQALRYDVVAEAVKADPESAAALVSAVARAREVPSMIAQMAMTVAAVYESELGDDSLRHEIDDAPWFGKIAPPTFKPDEEAAEPVDPLTKFLADSPDTIRALVVDQDDLRTGSVEVFVRIFSVGSVGDGAIDKERALRASALWGQCLLSFPLDDDPRGIAAIPSARRYVANLHRAMPYFPCYLHFRKEAGMFLAYFGCLADEEAISSEGVAVDLFHQSVFDVLGESLDAVGRLATAIGKDPRPLWRAIMSAYPPDVIEDVVNELYGKLN